MQNRLIIHEEGIQVVAILFACEGQPPRVDEIRPFLEGSHFATLLPPNSDETKGEDRFP
jgi:hypothetical protein